VKADVLLVQALLAKSKLNLITALQTIYSLESFFVSYFRIDTEITSILK
jgi:hypothetical protein